MQVDRTRLTLAEWQLVQLPSLPVLWPARALHLLLPSKSQRSPVGGILMSMTPVQPSSEQRTLLPFILKWGDQQQEVVALIDSGAEQGSTERVFQSHLRLKIGMCELEK